MLILKYSKNPHFCSWLLLINCFLPCGKLGPTFWSQPTWELINCFFKTPKFVLLIIMAYLKFCVTGDLCSELSVRLPGRWTAAALSDSPAYTWAPRQPHETSHWYPPASSLSLDISVREVIKGIDSFCLVSRVLVSRHGHPAPARLWPVQRPERAGSSRRTCAVPRRDGGVELFRGELVRGGTGEIRQGLQRYPARLCEWLADSFFYWTYRKDGCGRVSKLVMDRYTKK